MKTIKKNVSHKKKLSRKGEIYGYGRKQNNSRLKMKSKRKSKSKSNIKKKRSILRGGSMGNISSNGNPVDRNNGFILVSKKSIVESLNLSPNYISFKINNKEEISFKIDEISVEKLQYFLLQKLLKITPDNKIKINDKLFIMDARKNAYNKGGNNLIDVYEDASVKMLSYEESLTNFFDINDITNIKIVVGKNHETNEDISINNSYNQDIDWLRKIIFDFNDISKENNPKNKLRNLDRFLDPKRDPRDPKETKIFTKCDLNIADQTKIIAEKIRIGNEVFVICGYPHISMRPQLKLYEEPDKKALFNDIYSDQKNHMIDYIITLFNLMNPSQKPRAEIYKFYEKNNMHLKYLIEYYKKIIEKFLKEYKSLVNTTVSRETTVPTEPTETTEPIEPTETTETTEPIEPIEPIESINKPEIKQYLEKKFQEEYKIPYIENFKDEVSKLQNAFYCETASKYLNKPLMYIKYVFIIFKEVENKNDYKKPSKYYPEPKNPLELPYENQSENIYVPAIFNFRELTHKHYPILKRLEILIKTKLPEIYGITKSGEEYNLFYSTYKYGNVFSIQTEYLHTLSNIFQSSYKYKINITLEEIIYMLSTEGSNLQTLRVDYKIKNNIINNYFKKVTKSLKKETKSLSNNTFSNSTDKTPCDYNKSLQQLEIDLTLNTEFMTSTDIKILFMFKETGTFYTFIYLNKNKACIIQFVSNLCQLQDILHKNLITYYKSYIKDENNFLYKCRNISQYIINLKNFEIFKIIKHQILSTEEYKSYLSHNPILKKNIEILNKIDNSICLNLFIPNTSCILIPNIYKTKPIFIRNYLGTQTYKDAFEDFKLNFNTRKSYSTVIVNKEDLQDKNRVYYIIEEDVKRESKGIINRIHFNLNNCGYNFIEIYEELYENTYKYVVWVVPLNATEEENINDDFTGFDGLNNVLCPYIGNFMDLNEKHIKMLIEIKKLYLNNKDIFNNNSECVLNITTISPTYHCVHFHIYENKEYKSGFIKNEIGSRISGDLTLNKILNNITWKHNYYNSININIFRI